MDYYQYLVELMALLSPEEQERVLFVAETLAELRKQRLQEGGEETPAAGDGDEQPQE